MILTEEQKDKLNKMSVPKSESDNNDIKKCPYCQMEISSKAIICPYCRSDLKFTIREVCPKCKEKNAVHKIHIAKHRRKVFIVFAVILFIIAFFVFIFIPMTIDMSRAIDYEFYRILGTSLDFSYIPVGQIIIGFLLAGGGVLFSILYGLKYKKRRMEYLHCNSCGNDFPIEQVKSTGGTLNPKDSRKG